MSTAAVRILVVGLSAASTQSTLRTLARSGWESHSVETLREAEAVLRTIRFQVILANEKLPDGAGYELTSVVERQHGNLFISVPLSETSLWLPAVENGVRSLGERALNPTTLATEAEVILQAADASVEAPARERRGRNISAKAVVRADVDAMSGELQLAGAARAGRKSSEEREQHEYAETRQPMPPRRQLTRVAAATPEHPLPVIREGEVRDAAGGSKRWRGI